MGFVLAALLGLTDIPSVLVPTTPGQVGPPRAVLVLSILCGLVTVGAVGYGWARRSWPAIRAAAGARVISMLGAMPALFVDGLPGFIRVLVAAFVLLTIATVTLMLVPSPRSSAAGGVR